MKKFSLCVPTRERPQHVERLIGTLKDTIDDTSRVEILFRIDDDDMLSQCYIGNLIERFPELSIQMFVGKRTDFLNKDYFNALSKEANGEYHWVMGDDVVFVHKSWDTHILEKIDSFFYKKRDEIAYVNIIDNTPLPPGVDFKYANFPLISKEAIEVIGFFMPPTINSWSSDYLIHLPYFKVKRIIELDHCILNHISSHTEAVEIDESAKRQRDFYTIYNIKEKAMDWEFNTAPFCSGKLQRYINKCNGY